MQPSRIALVLLLAAGMGARADELSFKVDMTKVSDFQGKAFSLQDAPGFGGSAPGFDKAYTGAGSGTAPGWIDRRVDMGGRDVYGPDVKMDKAFTVPQTSLFQNTSPFSTQAAPFSMTGSRLPQDAPLNAPVDKFNAQVPFADKAYNGPENDRLRQAMDQLFDKDKDKAVGGVPDPLLAARKNNDALHKQLNAAGGHVSPIVTVDDVKLLLNKDVAPVPPSAVPEASSAPSGTTAATGGPVAQGVTVK